MKANNTIFVLILIIFLLGSLLMFDSVQDFQTGLHNADLGQNIRWIEASTGISFIDHTSDGTKTSNELYMLGMEQIKNNYSLSVILSFFLGALLMWLILNRF